MPPPYDLSPLFSLLLVGAALAAAPLLWLGWRQRRATPLRRIQALTLLTLFLTFDLVLFGAFTRLSDSGLGCPDWPGCYGQTSPLGAAAHIASAQQTQPSGPVTWGKAWVEMTHRYLATAVGGLILLLAWMRWRDWVGRRKAGQPGALHPGWALLTALWVCLQGAFGALTVTMKLFPLIVTLHLAGGLALLALLGLQVMHAAPYESPIRSVAVVSAGLRRLLWLTFALLGLQILLGGWVSTNYAVLACGGFPTCQGQWWPPMSFSQGFELWRPLGLRGDGLPIDFAALTAIHVAHRVVALVLLAVLGLLVWQLQRWAGLRRAARWLAALALLQLGSGLANVVFNWPLLAALVHTAGAAGLVLVLTGLVVVCRAQPQPLQAHRPSMAGRGA